MIRSLAILALMASPAGAATILPGFIEECRPVASHASQSMVPGQIRPNVALADCAVPPPYSLNPFAGDLYAKVPEVGNEYFLPVTPASVVGATSATVSLPSRGGGGALAAILPSPASAPSFFITIHEPPRMPVDEPAPVPLPSAAWLLVAALGLLWRRK